MCGQADPLMYQIVVKGNLDVRWSEWFGNLDMSVDENGYTLLTGPIADQVALRGILCAIWDLNLAVITVQRIEQNPNQRGVEYDV